jgi:Ankyrin repeats (3 copies)/Histidine phosphatase superfamily (branch 1)
MAAPSWSQTEDRKAVRRRMRDFVFDLHARAVKEDLDDVLVVCHNNAKRMLLHEYDGWTKTSPPFRMFDNCEATLCRFDGPSLVEARGPVGHAFFRFARMGNVEGIEAFLANGANPNTQYGQVGKTAMMLAAKRGHTDVVKLLLRYGASPSLSCGDFPDRTTALDRARLGEGVGCAECARIIEEAIKEEFQEESQ